MNSKLPGDCREAHTEFSKVHSLRRDALVHRQRLIFDEVYLKRKLREGSKPLQLGPLGLFWLEF